MRVKILKRSFVGAEFAPDVRVLKVGGQSSAGVEKLEFELPAEWQGLSVTLHVQWLDGTLPAPVLLDDEDSVAVDKTLTASLKGAGTIEGASGGIISFTLSRGNAWEGFSFTITGADATTRVVFAPAVKSKNRVQFDNFRAESLTR